MSDQLTPTPSPCHCINLRLASRMMTKLYDDILKPSGLRITQYALLSRLHRSPKPMTINELSQSLQVERTTLLRNLNPLLQAGLVETQYPPASKAYWLILTDKGQATWEAARPLWVEAQEMAGDILGEAGMDMLRTVTAKLALTKNFTG